MMSTESRSSSPRRHRSIPFPCLASPSTFLYLIGRRAHPAALASPQSFAGFIKIMSCFSGSARPRSHSGAQNRTQGDKLRRHFRVKLFADSGFDLTIQGKNLRHARSVPDGSALPSAPVADTFRPGRPGQLTLDFEGKSLYLAAKRGEGLPTMKSRSDRRCVFRVSLIREANLRRCQSSFIGFAYCLANVKD